MPLAEIPLRAWHKRAHEFVFRGHTIRYWVAGQGEPLLLIHGFPTASWDWHYLWQPLAQRNLVIACDMLGFGESAKPPRTAGRDQLLKSRTKPKEFAENLFLVGFADSKKALTAEFGVVWEKFGLGRFDP